MLDFSLPSIFPSIDCAHEGIEPNEKKANGDRKRGKEETEKRETKLERASHGRIGAQALMKKKKKQQTGIRRGRVFQFWWIPSSSELILFTNFA
ncbi:hypothetical protein EUGRSUZ_C02342 [Eucalyptus grandis]|uniref:Uncharacterized protein n=2 Tax=Eucalyptus grandis TaxID=71139 RepID=A0ACC3LFF9_EUCGR|nr:hypothetical protein EUGRSUZ_C02342 [Eucalyptus grandis]